MEIFRVSRDVYGREVLQGMSWDLLWVFFVAGVAFVCVHALYSWLLAPKRR
jgi:formate dehydrogenase subunit gamma